MSEAPGKYFKPIAEGNSPATADKAVENASGQFRHNKVEGDASAAYNQLRADVVKYESENKGDQTKTKAFVETVSKKLEENGLLPAVKIAALRQTDEQESFAPSNPTEQQIKAKLDQQEKTYGIQLLDDTLTKDVQDKIQRDQYLAVLKSIKSEYVQKNKQYFTVEPARGDGKAVVPPADGKATVPPTDGTAVVPPTDGTAVLPPTDGAAVVPPTDGTAVVPPTDGKAVVPPTDGTAVPPTETNPLAPPAATQNVEASSIQDVLAKPVAGASSVFEQADLAGSGKPEEQADKLVGKKDLEALIAAPTFDEDLGSQIKSTLIDKWDDAEFQRKYLTNGYLDPAKIQTEVSSTSVSQSPDDSDPADKNILAKGLDLAKEHPAETVGAAALLTIGGIVGWKTLVKNGVKEVVENPAVIEEGAELLVKEGAEGLGKTVVTEGVEGAGKTIVTEGVEGAGKTIVTEGVEGAGKTIVKEGAEGGSTILNKTADEIAAEIDNLNP
jgi:hypothetical protein